VLVTSPVPSHPSTALIETVLRSFELVPGLTSCRRVLMCDGARSGPRNAWKRGRYKQESIRKYAEYLDRVTALATAPESVFYGVEIVRLPDRVGFGGCVSHGLSLVTTPLVMIVQHDWKFDGYVDLPRVITAIHRCPDIRYVGFLSTSQRLYITRLKSCGQPSLARLDLQSRVVEGLHFTPLLFWHDKIHICSVLHYRTMLASRYKEGAQCPGTTVVKSGDFIEDTLGQLELTEIKEQGMAAHARYATFLLGTGEDPKEAAVISHLNGRAFLSPEQRLELPAYLRGAGVGAAAESADAGSESDEPELLVGLLSSGLPTEQVPQRPP
jgi:hypothetical protein